jgi:hypothetical protein
MNNSSSGPPAPSSITARRSSRAETAGQQHLRLSPFQEHDTVTLGEDEDEDDLMDEDVDLEDLEDRSSPWSSNFHHRPPTNNPIDGTYTQTQKLKKYHGII